MDLFKLGAKKGDSHCQYSIGYIYETGKGVIKDESIAKEWYKKGIDGGSKFALEAYNDMMKPKSNSSPSINKKRKSSPCDNFSYEVRWKSDPTDFGNGDRSISIGITCNSGVKGVIYKWLGRNGHYAVGTNQFTNEYNAAKHYCGCN